MRNADPVTIREAAEILGSPVEAVQKYVDDGLLDADPRFLHRGLDRHSVEALACEIYSYVEHRNDHQSYWVSGERAAMTLGVDRASLERLASEHRLDYAVHRDGTRLYRRHELVALQRVRDSRGWP